MKLIKISLLSLIVLPVSNIWTNDSKPANTGAAKSSDSAAVVIAPRKEINSAISTTLLVPQPDKPSTAVMVSKIAHHSPIHEDLHFPTLAAVSTTAAASGKSKSKSTKIAKPIEPDASELPTEFSGSQLEISTKHGEYKPKIYSSWNFPGTFKALKSDEPTDLRSIEKASAEAWQNPEKFDPEQVAEFAQLVNEKRLDINPAYWGDLHGACKRAKEQEAHHLVKLIQESAMRLQRYKTGEVASLQGYGRSNGTGYSSPIAEYGMGPKFSADQVAACQQMIAKAFEITARKDATSNTQLDGDLVEVPSDFDKK